MHIFLIICNILQETTGSFGSRVEKLVDEYIKKYTDVNITSLNPGMLSPKLYKNFLISVVKPYIKKESFLLPIDSWSRQSDSVLFDEVFRNDRHLPTCTVQVILLKCTPLVQPRISIIK